MTEIEDSCYHFQLARTDRQLASGHTDRALARLLREGAIKSDRKARQLSREEALLMKHRRAGPSLLAKFLRWKETI